MRTALPLILPLVCLGFAESSRGQLVTPQIGWQAELSRLFHNVSGTVTIVDENTIQVDDFTYDGGGISVYFYLGHEQTRDSFKTGLQIGPQLLGTPRNGTEPPLVIDLPSGQTLEGWNAVSVWCVAAGSSFGDGTFAPVGGPTPGDFNDDGLVDAADYVVWRNGLGQEYDDTDYTQWRANFGASSANSAAPNSAPFPMATVPEPFSGRLLIVALLPLLVRRASK
jgi:hypothetical protein